MPLEKYFRAIKIQDQSKYIKTYVFLVILRVCLVFLPHLGYIHPDEFFQSVEIPTGKHFVYTHKNQFNSQIV